MFLLFWQNRFSIFTYGYDAGNRLLTLTDSANGNITRGYDSFDRKISETTAQGIVSYTYDNASRRATLQAPGQAQVVYAYDSANRLTGITQGAQSVGVGIGYDNANRRTSLTLPNGINLTYGYDTSHTVGATNYPYTYPSSSNRLTSFTGPAARSYSYDASGNTLTTSSGYAFSYDARGRMTNITAGSVNQYGINALGQRLTKAGTGYTGTQRYVYSEEGKLLGEYDNTGATILDHVYLNDTPLAVLKGTGAYLVQADQLNTPRAILGAANALVWKWDSDALGVTAANENPSALGIFNYNLRFPGQYYDKESTFHYNYFRDYNPKTGRYIESDPIGLKGGIDTYAYVGGNPLMYYDPYGLEALGDCVANNRWDWGKFGPAGNDGLSNTGATVTSANLANTTANVAVGRTGAGAGTASHSTSWEHRVGSKIGQSLRVRFPVACHERNLSQVVRYPAACCGVVHSAQFAENGRRFGSTQAAWSSAGKLIGRALIFPLIFEGFYDIGTIGRCSCTSD